MRSTLAAILGCLLPLAAASEGGRLSPSLLQALPATAVLKDPDWHYWGGSMVRGADGTCHLFIARWPKAKGFNAWCTHSEVARCTAPTPLGPYTYQETVLGVRPGAWDADNAHNPHVLAADGKFYLYYTGNRGDGSGWWGNRNHQRVGVAVAERPEGPWLRQDQPLLDVTPGGFDHLVANCPIVTRHSDGTFYMVYKGVSDGKRPFGGKVRMGLATSRFPDRDFVKQPGNFFDAPGVQFPSDDNFIWYADGAFHAIVKDYGGHFQQQAKEALVLFDSPDARNWTVRQPDPVLTTFRLRWADGRVTEPLHRLDQPQLWRDAQGRPAVLFLAVKERADKDDADVAYNVHVPLLPPDEIR